MAEEQDKATAAMVGSEEEMETKVQLLSALTLGQENIQLRINNIDDEMHMLQEDVHLVMQGTRAWLGLGLGLGLGLK